KEEARLFLIILGVAIWLVAINLKMSGHSASLASGLRESFLPVHAIGSTPGYGNGTDWDQWPLFSQWVLMILMVFGGCAGSTAGGIKLHRVLLFARILRHEITHLFRPQQVFRTHLDGQQIDRDGQMQLMSYLGLVAAIMLVSMAVISLIEPSIGDMNTAFGSVIATFLNIGPGFGAVGPTDNFGHFGSGSLLFLSFLMLLGRLEIMVVIALFSRTLWQRY
ncbi:MAG: potassium transporter TrkG, partial [Verrucomicrobiota bacterium]